MLLGVCDRLRVRIVDLRGQRAPEQAEQALPVPFRRRLVVDASAQREHKAVLHPRIPLDAVRRAGGHHYRQVTDAEATLGVGDVELELRPELGVAARGDVELELICPVARPVWPLSLLRARLQRERVLDIAQVRQLPHGRGAHVAGIVVQRQRPGTAKGTVFVTLEDEHGPLNVVVWQDLAARRRKVLLGARLMAVRGR